MRVPRHHRFRTQLSARELFLRLPRERRFRLAGSAATSQIFGAEPVAIVTGTDSDGIPKDELRVALPHMPDCSRPHFPGGAIGYVAYERGYDVEGLPRALASRAPDVWFGIYDTFARTLPETGEVEVTSWGLTADGMLDERLARARAEDLEEALRSSETVQPSHDRLSSSAPPSSQARASLDEHGHALAVAEILDAIRRGDLYQGNLTIRFEVPTTADPTELFETLLRENPAPYSLFLETDAGCVLSCSPERLLSARGRHLETRPIKGTSARDADPARDAALARALLASEKNRAELLMITDLLRNDLGKVCRHGTVRVPALAVVESFPHLHHLVSTIVGELRSGLDVLDALEAVFPCGSIAGAPKRRAMEILRALEPAPRGVYAGTVGWIGFDRSAELAVAIRTGFLANGVFSFGSGGGIVADSDAASEWEELLLKARAFAMALGVDLRDAAGSVARAEHGRSVS